MMLSRRALAARLAAGAAAIGIAGRAGAAVPAPDPDLREAALRGLALADLRGDPVGAAAARAAAARLAGGDPEGALLYRLYRKLDERPSAYWRPALLITGGQPRPCGGKAAVGVDGGPRESRKPRAA